MTLLLIAATALAKDVTVKDVKDSANKALDGVEKTVKTAAGETKKGGNSLLQSVDDAVHRIFGAASSKASKELDKKQ